jgi:hypothetical protein
MNRTCIIILLLTLSLPLFSQIDPVSDASFLSGDQKLVRMAVDSSLCILRQEYTLTNHSGKEYGRNGKDYFGKTYSLGVLANNKVWTDSRLLRPWEADGNYDKFRTIDSIRPRLSGTYARQLVRSAYAEVKQDTALQATDSGIAILHSPDTLVNIALISNCRDRGGWLVVAASHESFSTSDTLPVSYTIYKAQPQFTASGNKGYLKNMPVRENIIGGVYFISSILLGKITFSAAGILGKDKQGWYVQLFPAAGEKKKTEDLTPLKKINNLR